MVHGYTLPNDTRFLSLVCLFVCLLCARLLDIVVILASVLCRDHPVTEFCTSFQSPYPWTPSPSYNLPPLSHLCHLGQTVWSQLPTSPALWPMRAPSSGSGPSHLGSPSPRCGSLMGQELTLCRYLRSLLPMQATTHAQPASVDSLLIVPLLFNSTVSETDI